MTQKEMEDKIIAFYERDNVTSFSKGNLFTLFVAENKEDAKLFPAAFNYLVSNSFLDKTNPTSTSDYYLLGAMHRNYRTIQQEAEYQKQQEQKERIESLKDQEQREFLTIVNNSIIETNASIRETNISIKTVNNRSQKMMDDNTDMIDFQKKTIGLTIMIATLTLIAIMVPILIPPKESESQRQQQQIEAKQLKILNRIDSLLSPPIDGSYRDSLLIKRH